VGVGGGWGFDRHLQVNALGAGQLDAANGVDVSSKKLGLTPCVAEFGHEEPHRLDDLGTRHAGAAKTQRKIERR
jgi:hypothetical protein